MVKHFANIHSIHEILLMEKILHELIGSLSKYLQGFKDFKVVQDFFHQEYFFFFKALLGGCPSISIK